MSARARLLTLVAVVVSLATAVAPSRSATLGRIDFPNSGAAEAQDPFVRGVLLLHSFEYEDAREAFREAQRIDPDFALAYWGEAMTHNHPLWAQQDREAALEALAKLAPTAEERYAKAGSDRERGYLQALEALYGEGDKPSRDRAYMEAMRELHERHPGDLEAKAFYALSILGSVPERDFRVYMRAGAVAEEVFAENPLHPGAAHYLIHSYDDPIHAPLGLRPARVYATIAPDASHAQHMISHIYTALGEWDEVIEANRNAVRVSEERLERLGRPLHGRNKHSLHWLEYGLLQVGRFDEARAVLATMQEDAVADPTLGQLWHYAAMRAAWVVGAPQRGDAPPAMVLEGVALEARAADAFADGVLALRRDDRTSARAALEQLRDTIETTRVSAPEEGRNSYDGATDESAVTVARIHLLQLEGLVARADGNAAEAVARVGEAAELEAARALEYGPPSVVKPSHELLGELLLDEGRFDEARVAFEKALDRAPRRTLSLIGLARAAEGSGDRALAEETREVLRELWRGSGDPLELSSSLVAASAASGR